MIAKSKSAFRPAVTYADIAHVVATCDAMASQLVILSSSLKHLTDSVRRLNDSVALQTKEIIRWSTRP